MHSFVTSRAEALLEACADQSCESVWTEIIIWLNFDIQVAKIHILQYSLNSDSNSLFLINKEQILPAIAFS